MAPKKPFAADVMHEKNSHRVELKDSCRRLVSKLEDAILDICKRDRTRWMRRKVEHIRRKPLLGCQLQRVVQFNLSAHQ